MASSLQWQLCCGGLANGASQAQGKCHWVKLADSAVSTSIQPKRHFANKAMCLDLVALVNCSLALDCKFSCPLHAMAAFVPACFSAPTCSACPHPAGRALGLGAADCAQTCVLGRGAAEPTKPLASMVRCLGVCKHSVPLPA